MRLGNMQVNGLERQMCCVSDVENGAQSGTIRASEYTKQWNTCGSECVLSRSQSRVTVVNGLWMMCVCVGVRS